MLAGAEKAGLFEHAFNPVLLARAGFFHFHKSADPA